MGAWNPWRELRHRAEITFARAPLPGGVNGCIVALDDGTVVLVDEGLGRRERNATLAHELVHHERGLLPAGAPKHVVAKEERQVEDETARRLVPADELRAVAASLLDVAEAVEAWQLAEHFDVTEAVIHRRVDELRRRHGL